VGQVVPKPQGERPQEIASDMPTNIEKSIDEVLTHYYQGFGSVDSPFSYGTTEDADGSKLEPRFVFFGRLPCTPMVRRRRLSFGPFCVVTSTQ